MKHISGCMDILITAPFFLGYVWTADKFLEKFLGTTKKRELLFILFSFCGWLLISIAGKRYAVPYIFSQALNSILFMGLVLLLFQSDREKRILAASMLMMGIRLVRNFCESFLSCLALFFRYTVEKSPAPLVDEWEDWVISCIGHCLVMFAVCWMSRHLESVFCGKPKKWYAILAVPLLVITVVIDVAAWGASNGIMVRSGGNMGLYYDEIASHAEFMVLSLLSMSAAGVYVFGMNRIYLEQEKSDHYHSQIAVYKMLTEQYSQSERLRHDMKNHIIALSALSQNKEWEKIDSYLKDMESIVLETGGDMTGNKAVDALLYQKRKQAEEENIEWECDVQIPKEYCINEFDLCVLFGNILDNALEACERMQCGEYRFINIQARRVKKCFLLEAKNSMDSSDKICSRSLRNACVRDAMEHKYADGFTKKDNAQGHGIGLLNVGDVVDKYNGAVHIGTEKEIFTISILIPLNDAAHDIKTTV